MCSRPVFDQVLPMKPHFERVTFPKDCSLRVYHRRVPEIPFEWHHHPVYELTLTLNSRGWRFIGDHISQYHAPDLVLVPPDMPHTWASTATLSQPEIMSETKSDNQPETKPETKSESKSETQSDTSAEIKSAPQSKLPSVSRLDLQPASHPQDHTAIVLWFSRPWALQLAELCPEYAPLRRLLQHASTGLAFSPAAAAYMAANLPQLLSDSPLQRLHAALATLLYLGEQLTAHAATSLSKALLTVPASTYSESAQLTRIFDHLHTRFSEPVSIATLSDVGNLSARSLHRLFIKHTGENVTDYLSRLRIGRACMRLVETDLPISMIAFEVGLPNLANFNRQFRRVRGIPPSAYRRSYQQQRGLPEANSPSQLLTRPPSLDPPRKRARQLT